MHEFELLADPTRRRIVELLAAQELSVVVLTARVAERSPVSRSAVSHQLAVLRRAEFVEVRDWGPERRYRLAWNAMDRVDAAVESLWTIWEDRVGWPYEAVREPPGRLHRAGRRGLRDRTRAEIEPREGDDSWWRYLPD
jgi:DNA-binding transcriptional ArsR family regulator